MAIFQKPRVKALLSLMALLFSLGTPLAVQAVSPPNDWVMTFSDEFNGTTLDKSKWNTTFPGGRRTTPTNQEAEWYVDDAFKVSNGILRIQASKKQVGNYPYTSGMIATWGKFSQRYGFFEMRARLPKGKGMWPAFWLLPAAGGWPPEVDMMENIGSRPTSVYFSNHATVNGALASETLPYTGPDFTKDFHVFSMAWSPTVLIYYVDGVERARITKNVPQVSMYLIANLAVGGKWAGYPDATVVFPAFYDIDYIRVFSPPKTASAKAKTVKIAKVH